MFARSSTACMRMICMPRGWMPWPGATLGVMNSASLAVAVIACGCRVGWQGGPGAQVARRFGHRIARIQCRRSGLCACQGDEGGLVSCRQQRRGLDRHAGEPLRQTLDCRAKFPRHQGSAVRHGACCDAHRRTNPARPTAAQRCICNAAATMLGAAGESPGMDRLFKSNTSKTRTDSLFRQGCMLYDSSQPCQITDYPRSWPASLRPYQTAGRSAECSRSCEMRG